MLSPSNHIYLECIQGVTHVNTLRLYTFSFTPLLQNIGDVLFYIYIEIHVFKL